MKAAVRRGYGLPESLRIEEVPTPTPRDDEVLIRVEAASVNLGDWELLTGVPRYVNVFAHLFAPKPRHDPLPDERKRWLGPKHPILGCDIAGRVEAVGRSVMRFRPGDEVFGDCGIAGFGGFAEYCCVPETAAIVAKSQTMTFVQAAAIPQGWFIAVHGLHRQAKVRAGQRVLINGAGGGAGTFAVQLAKADGAEVTAVDGPGKQELLRSLGADRVLDYTADDFTRSGERYDVIVDLAAYRAISSCRRALTADGIYLMAGGSWSAFWRSAMRSPFSRGGNGRVALLLAGWSREDLGLAVELFEAGKVVPVIDRCYPLAETGEALRRLGEKRSLGKVIVTPWS